MRGSIQKKKGNYYVVLALGGKRKWIPAGRTKHGAEKVLAEEVSRTHRGPYRELKKLSFKEFTPKWLEEYARGKVKESTFESYQQIFRTHLLPYFGDYPLQQITPEDIQKYVTLKRREGQIAPKTINNTLVPLKEMFKHAVRWRYLHESPAIYVEKPRVPRKEMDFLTREELRQFLEHVHAEHYVLFLTACLTGMRRGELLAMKWSNLDWNRRQYFIKESLYKSGFTEPKSSYSMRAVNLPPVLLASLKRHHVKQAEIKLGNRYDSHDMDLIFCKKDGKPLDPNNLVKRIFLPTLKRAGMRRIRFHDLRHTFASLLIAQGENPKYIQNQLGHSSIQTTLDRYGHLMPETHRQAAERLQEAVFGVNHNSQPPLTCSTNINELMLA